MRENGIRGLLRGFGLKMGSATERAFTARARELANGRKSRSAVTLPLLLVRATLLCQRERLHRLVVTATRGDAVCRRLTTLPGVGPATALTFCSAVDDPARFSRSRAVGAHFGPMPRRYQSGETDRVGQIGKQGDGMARQALCDAANVPLTRTSRWSSLKALGRLLPTAPDGDGSGALRPMGMSLAKRSGMRRAKVAVARKLAVVPHRMWCDGTEFRWGKESAAA